MESLPSAGQSGTRRLQDMVNRVCLATRLGRCNPTAQGWLTATRSMKLAPTRERGHRDGRRPRPDRAQARELVDVLRGPEEWDHGPGWMRPIPMVALNDHQVALIYSLVLLALVQKTGSTADRHGQPRYSDVRHRWLVATAEELRRFGPGWRRCGARGSERSSSSGSVGWRGSRHRGVAGRGRAAARRAHGRACG
jgi:hypothetical protein